MHACVAVVVVAAAARGQGVLACDTSPTGDEHLNVLARTAVEGSAEESPAAIAALRRGGAPALDALFDVYAGVIEAASGESRLRRPPRSRKTHPRRRTTRAGRALKPIIDEVAGQYDAHASHLYWYTDAHEAKLAAAREGKPILCLELLGKLTDQYSCANSRFFRSTAVHECRSESRAARTFRAVLAQRAPRAHRDH